MPKFNSTYSEELKGKVPSEEEGGYILGMSIEIGSFNAREQLSKKGYFTSKNDTTSKIEEAKFIAEEQENILRLLEVENTVGVIETLEHALNVIHEKDEVPSSQLSSCIDRLREQEGKMYPLIMGSRIEKRLKESKRKHPNPPTERDMAKTFLDEEYVMRHSVLYELNHGSKFQ
ncbi:MAG: hypothetical protein CMH64_01305 [Nanoarchaeota archaeon]|nr:hypothetical protein [Nanoarchaeota archaeon]